MRSLFTYQKGSVGQSATPPLLGYLTWEILNQHPVLPWVTVEQSGPGTGIRTQLNFGNQTLSRYLGS